MKFPKLLAAIGLLILLFLGMEFVFGSRHRARTRVITQFLDAMLKGGNPGLYYSGPPRAASDPAYFAGMTGYKIVESHTADGVLVEVRFPGYSEKFRLYNIHGSVGRIEPAERDSCLLLVLSIQRAKARWAQEHRKARMDVPTPTELGPYFRNGELPRCPCGGHYSIGTVMEPVRCSILEPHWGPRMTTP